MRFIDEYVLTDDTTFNDTRVGGLSGIDYADGNWYVISDDSQSPRFYSASLHYTMEGFNSILINTVTYFKDEDGTAFIKGIVDPESIRYDRGNYICTSEGNIKSALKPFVRISDSNEKFVGIVPPTKWSILDVFGLRISIKNLLLNPTIFCLISLLSFDVYLMKTDWH